MSFCLEGLENKTESLGTPMQIVDYSRAVACLVGRGPGVDVFHSVTHGVVEEDCDLAGRGDCAPTRAGAVTAAIGSTLSGPSVQASRLTGAAEAAIPYKSGRAFSA